MGDYQKLFLDAMTNVLTDYQNGKIKILSEADLQSHLFFECRKLMEQRNFSCPLKLLAERGIFSRHTKVDLVLGDDEVLIELKVEPDYPGVSKPVVFSTKAEAAGSGSVENDLEKVEEYARKGKHAHFLMIDEDGRHARKVHEKWKAIQVRGKRSWYLHKYAAPKS
jgi:hypothetical protein